MWKTVEHENVRKRRKKRVGKRTDGHGQVWSWTRIMGVRDGLMNSRLVALQ